jgi:hypothetical protein
MGRAQRKPPARQAMSDNQEEMLHDRYDAFFASSVEEIRKSLAAGVLTEIEESAAHLVGESKFGRDVMIRIHANKIISERYNIPSFAEWRRAFSDRMKKTA